ncbi:uncharacterized protein O3C94_006987 [Discoglossus pictus]
MRLGVGLLFLLDFFTPAAGSFICPYADQDNRIEAFIGSSVDLPCPFTWEGTPPVGQEVVWQKVQEGEEDLVVHYQNGHSSEDKQSDLFHGRTFIRTNWFQRDDATLTLRNVSLKDIGVYKCYLVRIPLGKEGSKLCCKLTLNLGTHSEKSVTASTAERQNIYVIVPVIIIALALCLLFRKEARDCRRLRLQSKRPRLGMINWIITPPLKRTRLAQPDNFSKCATSPKGQPISSTGSAKTSSAP